jgi:hypothetical protein
MLVNMVMSFLMGGSAAALREVAVTDPRGRWFALAWSLRLRVYATRRWAASASLASLWVDLKNFGD